MSSKALAALLPAFLLLARVQAHGYIQNVTVNGVADANGDASPEWYYATSKPARAGWYADNQDSGFVAPSAFTGADIVCHKNATAGTTYVKAAAGDTLGLVWNTWPDSHHGPVIDYLAACNGDCTAVDKTQLSFAKIDQQGLLSGSDPGTWATDTLIANDFTWTMTLPSDLAPGNYVLRHEIIALHSAGSVGGAQAYPQCINLQITGSGTATPSGESAEKFYTEDEDGIVFNLYTSFSSYNIPGPALWSGASS